MWNFPGESSSESVASAITLLAEPANVLNLMKEWQVKHRFDVSVKMTGRKPVGFPIEGSADRLQEVLNRYLESGSSMNEYLSRLGSSKT